jgi:N6-adenosine-specific RNA methylase IME4
MNGLARYDMARAALAEAFRFDEVKAIRDKAVACRAYALQAKDGELIGYATDIRMRAERRAGEILRDMAEKGERDRGCGDRKSGSQSATPKLIDLGVSKSQSSRWQQLALLGEEEFERRAESAKREAVASIERPAGERLREKQESREARERELAVRQRALPDKRYGVILADPEWRFEPYSRVSGMDRAPENHYPTTETTGIAERDVASIAADDCALFLWATAPMIEDALRVLRAWGFAYKSQFVWNKNRIGMGYWNRNKHELLLIGVRGAIAAPAAGTQWDSVIDAPLAEHSAKPEVFLELIESYFPNLPKIELNRRGPAREGWDAWGLEAEGFEASS